MSIPIDPEDVTLPDPLYCVICGGPIDLDHFARGEVIALANGGLEVKVAAHQWHFYDDMGMTPDYQRHVRTLAAAMRHYEETLE